VLEHDGLHVLEHVRIGAAPEERVGPGLWRAARPHGLAERELKLHIPRVAEHGHERADAPRHARQGEAEIRPVDEQHLARQIVHGQVHLRVGAQPHSPNENAQDGEATG
jgi:hypothetical protein